MQTYLWVWLSSRSVRNKRTAHPQVFAYDVCGDDHDAPDRRPQLGELVTRVEDPDRLSIDIPIRRRSEGGVDQACRQHRPHHGNQQQQRFEESAEQAAAAAASEDCHRAGVVHFLPVKIASRSGQEKELVLLSGFLQKRCVGRDVWGCPQGGQSVRVDNMLAASPKQSHRKINLE